MLGYTACAHHSGGGRNGLVGKMLHLALLPVSALCVRKAEHALLLAFLFANQERGLEGAKLSWRKGKEYK